MDTHPCLSSFAELPRGNGAYLEADSEATRTEGPECGSRSSTSTRTMSCAYPLKVLECPYHSSPELLALTTQVAEGKKQNNVGESSWILPRLARTCSGVSQVPKPMSHIWAEPVTQV